MFSQPKMCQIYDRENITKMVKHAWFTIKSQSKESQYINFEQNTQCYGQSQHNETHRPRELQNKAPISGFLRASTVKSAFTNYTARLPNKRNEFCRICTVPKKLDWAINTFNFNWLVARSTCHENQQSYWGLLTVLLSSSQHRPGQYLTSDDYHILRVFVIHYLCNQSFNEKCYQIALFNAQITDILKFQCTGLITVNKCPTRCDYIQFYYIFCRQIYMFQMIPSFIIRSTLEM